MRALLVMVQTIFMGFAVKGIAAEALPVRGSNLRKVTWGVQLM